MVWVRVGEEERNTPIKADATSVDHVTTVTLLSGPSLPHSHILLHLCPYILDVYISPSLLRCYLLPYSLPIFPPSLLYSLLNSISPSISASPLRPSSLYANCLTTSSFPDFLRPYLPPPPLSLPSTPLSFLPSLPHSLSPCPPHLPQPSPCLSRILSPSRHPFSNLRHPGLSFPLFLLA